MFTTENKLRAMVLVYQPALTHSVWQDFECRARSKVALERILRAGVKDGRWVGWRLIRLVNQVMGNCN